MAFNPIARRNILTVYLKELRDTLRDRRTLFAAIILPVIINPLLFIGLFTMMSSQTAKQRALGFRVSVVNGEAAPLLSRMIANYETPRALGQAVFIPGADAGLQPADILELSADSDSPRATATGISLPTWYAEEFGLAGTVGGPTPTRPGLSPTDLRKHAADLLDEDEALRLQTANDDAEWQMAYWRLDRNHSGWLESDEVHRACAIRMLKAGEIDVAIVFPADFEANLLTAVPRQRPEVLYLGSSDASDTAAQHIRSILRSYTEPLTPMDLISTDVKTGSKSIKEIARFIPYLIILMVLAAAFTPAIDLMAGEKERGTIETLLISPASRREIIGGKFLCVSTVAIAAAALNLASLGVTVAYIGGQVSSMAAVSASAQSAPMEPAGVHLTDDAQARMQAAAAAHAQPQTAATQTAPTAMPPTGARGGGGPAAELFPSIPFYLYPVVLLLMIPAAALFAAISLAISSFAKSYKEGQYYITPVMMIAIPLSMISLLPGIEFNWQWGLVPISNFALLFRDLMTQISAGDTLAPQMWGYIAEVVVVTAIYAWLALRWATSIFYREDILFREAEEFNWKIWLKPGPPRATPSPGSAFLAFVISLIAFFFIGQSWQLKALMVPADEIVSSFARAHVMTQLLLIALPCVIFAFVNKYRMRDVFRYDRWRPVLPALGVLLIMPGLSILMVQASIWMAGPDAGSSGGSEALGALTSSELPLLGVIALMAIVPGIFEEILFRGYVLSGMIPDSTKRGRDRDADGRIITPWNAIIVTAVLFGVMHLQLVRVPLLALAGVVLGWLAWRTRTLWISIFAHALFNSTSVLVMMLPSLQTTVLVTDEVTQMPTAVQPWILAVAALMVVAGIYIVRMTTTDQQFEPWEKDDTGTTINRVLDTSRRITAQAVPGYIPPAEPPSDKAE